MAKKIVEHHEKKALRSGRYRRGRPGRHECSRVPELQQCKEEIDALRSSVSDKELLIKASLRDMHEAVCKIATLRAMIAQV